MQATRASDAPQPGTGFGLSVFVGAVRTRGRHRQWLMRCSCGVERWCRPSDVRGGRADRCLSCAKKQHGHASGGVVSRLYTIWRGVKARCFNEKSNRFEHYGGRGITMAPAWRVSFAAFARDVGQPPSEKHTLDRIDVDGHYEPGNTRWATAAEQNANRRCASAIDDFAEPDTWDYYDEAAE